jgi:hypothetical protein
MAIISNGTTVASGGSVTVSSSAVASATASVSAGAVGSYALISRSSDANANEGTTYSGSLYFSNVNVGRPRTASGTWRLMGTFQTTNSSANCTVMLRIS